MSSAAGPRSNPVTCGPSSTVSGRAVEPLLGTSLARDRDALMHQAVRANIRMSANQLRHGSKVLEQLIDTGGLRVVGAEYSLDTGEVEFFDGVEF